MFDKIFKVRYEIINNFINFCIKEVKDERKKKANFLLQENGVYNDI